MPEEATAGYQRFQETKFFSSLNGLRCFSIMGVIWHHSGGNNASIPFLLHGNLGVNLFFVISGFLITTLLLRERDSYGQISLKLFYCRRSLRVFPLYYAVLFGYVILVWVFEGDSQYGEKFFHNLKFYLSYTSNWFVSLDDPRVIFFFAWSLATEEQFYLLWPWLERYCKNNWPVFIAIFLIFVDQCVSVGLLFPIFSSDSLTYKILSSIATPICLGVLLAHGLHNPEAYLILFRFLGGRWMSVVCFLFLLLAVSNMDILPTGGQLVVEFSMVLFVASCVIREDHALARLLRWRLIAWIGTISYGMYLLHMLVLNLVRRVVPTPLFLSGAYWEFFLGFCLVVGLASLSYYWFESLFYKQKLRFHQFRKK